MMLVAESTNTLSTGVVGKRIGEEGKHVKDVLSQIGAGDQARMD